MQRRLGYENSRIHALQTKISYVILMGDAIEMVSEENSC